jgi:hypothetical protein
MEHYKEYSIVLEVPKDFTLDNVIDEDLKYQIDQLFEVHPPFISPGTKPIAGYKVINAVIRVKETCLYPLSMVEVLVTLFDFGVIKGFKTFDAVENVGTEEDPVWKAHFYMPLSDDVIKYMDKELEDQPKIYEGVDLIDILDEFGNVIGTREEPHFVGFEPITQRPFTKYDGESPW